MKIFIILTILGGVFSFEFKHHAEDELEEVLSQVHAKCPAITKLYSVGNSQVLHLPLNVIQFAMPSEDGEIRHEIGRPEFKYVGNMHGNEVVGRELLLKLADYLCERYLAGDKDVRNLLNLTSIHLMPTMNPDGYDMAYSRLGEGGWTLGRENGRAVDLNRDFPNLDGLLFYLEENGVPRFDHLMSIFHDESPHEAETRAVGTWILQRPFVLSANMHEGDLVSNYPFDLSRVTNKNVYSKSPDDATFRSLALSYSQKHRTMADPNRKPCDMGGDDKFAKSGGITNGARWYSVEGGMQDFNYLASNCFEITLELSCKKFPSAELLPQYWEDNKEAIFNFMWQVHTGIKGVIRDAVTKQHIPNAVVWVTNITDPAIPILIRHPVTSVGTGDYWRLLVPGRYNVTVQALGYQPASKVVDVAEPGHHAAQVVDFELRHSPGTRGLADSEMGGGRNLFDLESGDQLEDDEAEDSDISDKDLQDILERMNA